MLDVWGLVTHFSDNYSLFYILGMRFENSKTDAQMSNWVSWTLMKFSSIKDYVPFFEPPNICGPVISVINAGSSSCCYTVCTYSDGPCIY